MACIKLEVPRFIHSKDDKGPQNLPKNVVIGYWGPLKVTVNGTIQSVKYNFLLVAQCISVAISHRFQDIVTYL